MAAAWGIETFVERTVPILLDSGPIDASFDINLKLRGKDDELIKYLNRVPSEQVILADDPLRFVIRCTGDERHAALERNVKLVQGLLSAVGTAYAKHCDALAAAPPPAPPIHASPAPAPALAAVNTNPESVAPLGHPRPVVGPIEPPKPASTSSAEGVAGSGPRSTADAPAAASGYATFNQDIGGWSVASVTSVTGLGRMKEPAAREVLTTHKVEARLLGPAEPANCAKPRRSLEFATTTHEMAQEYSGNTDRAAKVRAALESLSESRPQWRIVNVRGDNFCAIRAVLSHLLVHTPSHLTSALQRLASLTFLSSQSLPRWRLSWERSFVASEATRWELQRCVAVLIRIGEELCNVSVTSTRFAMLRNCWNEDWMTDLRCNEVGKLLLFSEYVRLESAEDGALCAERLEFRELLFAVEGPSSSFLQTLAEIGDSHGLTQQHVLLLAYALDLSLEVVTLAHFGSPEFIMRVAAASDSELPCSCSILTEDGRHYRTFLRPDEPASN